MILHFRRFLISLLCPAALAAQEIPRAEYAARRDSLTARVDSGVVVAFGAPDAVGIGRWNQLPGFRYLTGFLEPNAVLVLVKRGGSPSGTLFTASRDPRRALYDGFPPDSAAVARETGLSVRSLPALRPMVDSLVASGLPVYDLRDFATADAATQDTLTRGARFVADLVARNPDLVVEEPASGAGYPAAAEESGGAGPAPPGHRGHGRSRTTRRCARPSPGCGSTSWRR